MKQVRMFSRMSEFEAFVNSPDVEIISLDIKAVEQNALFQECFCAVAYFKSVPVAPPHEDKGAEEILKATVKKYCPTKDLDDLEKEWETKDGVLAKKALIEAMQEYASNERNRILKVAESISFNVEDQAGNKLVVVDLEELREKLKNK